MDDEQRVLQLVRGASETLKEVDSVVSSLDLPKSLSTRAISAAGLIRCRSLLEGMLILFEAGSMGAIGALARIMFETWTCTMYMILGGEEALGRMVADAYSQTNPWVMGRNPDLDEILGGQPARRMPFRQICVALAEQMQERQLEDADLPLTAYDIIYRVESGISVHGGLAALMLPLVEPGGPILAERPEFDRLHASRRIAFSGFLLAYLAHWTLDAHGLSKDDFAWSQTGQ
jgi:hypothetical protein